MKEKIKIIVISNRYKNILKDVANSLDIKPLNMPRLVNNKPCNIMLGFKDSYVNISTDLSSNNYIRLHLVLLNLSSSIN